MKKKVPEDIRGLLIGGVKEAKHRIYITDKQIVPLVRLTVEDSFNKPVSIETLAYLRDVIGFNRPKVTYQRGVKGEILYIENSDEPMKRYNHEIKGQKAIYLIVQILKIAKEGVTDPDMDERTKKFLDEIIERFEPWQELSDTYDKSRPRRISEEIRLKREAIARQINEIENTDEFGYDF
jgi:polyhydroxyalkanoate synthesis regulator phasin